jgi:hypothetical protein
MSFVGDIPNVHLRCNLRSQDYEKPVEGGAERKKWDVRRSILFRRRRGPKHKARDKV